MDLHPQYTYDKNGNPIGVFIGIEEWREIEQELKSDMPQWQKDALDLELKAIDADPGYLVKWNDVKKQFLG